MFEVGDIVEGRPGSYIRDDMTFKIIALDGDYGWARVAMYRKDSGIFWTDSLINPDNIQLVSRGPKEAINYIVLEE